MLLSHIFLILKNYRCALKIDPLNKIISFWKRKIPGGGGG